MSGFMQKLGVLTADEKEQLQKTYKLELTGYQLSSIHGACRTLLEKFYPLRGVLDGAALELLEGELKLLESVVATCRIIRKSEIFPEQKEQSNAIHDSRGEISTASQSAAGHAGDGD